MIFPGNEWLKHLKPAIIDGSDGHVSILKVTAVDPKKKEVRNCHNCWPLMTDATTQSDVFLHAPFGQPCANPASPNATVIEIIMSGLDSPSFFGEVLGSWWQNHQFA